MEKLRSWFRNPLFIGAIAALIAGATGAVMVLVIILSGAGNGLSAEVWRNLILAVSAVVAFPVAIWRSLSASQQVKLSEAGYNTDRYQKGAEMLGDARLSVRQAGVFGLTELAENNFDAYHAIVMKVLCSFVVDRSHEQALNRLDGSTNSVGGQSKSVKTTGQSDIALDCQTAVVGLSILKQMVQDRKMEVSLGARDLDGANFRRGNLNLCILSDFSMISAGFHRCWLRRIDLQRADLRNAQFIGADLIEANLSNAKLGNADFRSARLVSAVLRDADLRQANLLNANLRDADLTGANLTDVRGLTVEQLETVKNVDADYLKQLRIREKAQEEELE